MDAVDYPDSDTKPKMPVQRGARACSTCRAAKMKCVSTDGEAQCQRCKRSNVPCVFEKHRRGRKPGSKLSEASKMLRKLEKGLNNAKSKAAVSLNTASLTDDGRYGYLPRGGDQPPFSSSSSHFSSNDLPPLNSPTYHGAAHPPSTSQSMDFDEDETDRGDGTFFPAKMIRRESQRNNEYFRTVLNSNDGTVAQNGDTASPDSPGSLSGVARLTASLFGPEQDPIAANLINEDDAKVLFDLFYLRLNPFINLFDPALHTCAYVRSKSTFLFTAILMASSKFFKIEIFKQCQRMANELAIRAFAEGTRSVEVIQAFACMTYWKDPDDTRTWSWIGYACRMAVDLGLNHIHSSSPLNAESTLQHLERRNRERTYLVLFVHDRSLSTQTGKNWMLLDDEFIQRSAKWHEAGASTPRPEDVIVTAFVQLRRIVAESTDIFNSYKNGSDADIGNYEVILRNCNSKLNAWRDTWEREMKRAGAESFHLSFMNIFRSYVKLFLNSFGLHGVLTSTTAKENPSLSALSACCMSAMDALKIVSKDLPSLSMLRYGQDSITIMSAYSAVFLLRLLRNPVTLPLLHTGTPGEIKSLIARTADAYNDAALLSPTWAVSSSNAAYHSRFLRLLLENDVFDSRRDKTGYDQRHTQNGMAIDPQLPAASPTSSQGHSPVYTSATPSYFANSPTHGPQQSSARTEYHNGMTMPARNGTVVGPTGYPQGAIPTAPPQASEPDMVYWKNTFIELGFGDEGSHYQNSTYNHASTGHPQQQYEQSQMYQQHATVPQQTGMSYQTAMGQVPSSYIR